MTKIAFLGLGAMGIRMATHLIDAGYELTVWNRTHEATEDLVAKGALAVASPAAAAIGSDAVISMVRDDDASRFVWLDKKEGALSAMSPGAIAIESSTLTIAWVEELGNKCERAGIQFADAPVAGSRPQAEAAKLIYFVGADQTTFEQLLPVLSVMGGAVHHTGGTGTGATIKLVVNALFGVQLAAIAELLGLLKNAGMGLQQALEIICATPAYSPVVKLSSEAMIAGQFKPAFPIELVEKDFSYAEAAAASVGTDAPLISATRKVLQRAMSQGFADDNITGIAKLYFGSTN